MRTRAELLPSVLLLERLCTVWSRTVNLPFLPSFSELSVRAAGQRAADNSFLLCSAVRKAVTLRSSSCYRKQTGSPRLVSFSLLLLCSVTSLARKQMLHLAAASLFLNHQETCLWSTVNGFACWCSRTRSAYALT